jgi:hypothetical protein
MERGMGRTDDAVESRQVVIEVVKGMSSENGSAGGICKNGRETARGMMNYGQQPKQTDNRREK